MQINFGDWAHEDLIHKQSLWDQQVLLVRIQILQGPAEAFVYGVPNAWSHRIELGQLVRIPLGRQSKLGIVCETKVPLTSSIKTLKYITDILYEQPLLTLDLIHLSRWIAEYYAASRSVVLETMIPAAIRNLTKEKISTIIQITPQGQRIDCQALHLKAPKQALAIRYLQNHPDGIHQATFKQQFHLSASTLKSLLEKGWIELRAQQALRRVYTDGLDADDSYALAQPICLNDEQKQASQNILTSIQQKQFQVHLLHGVTGSGKTEVYMEAAQSVLKEGGSVLFLVPEVALTPQTVHRLRARLCQNGVEAIVWHSHLSDGERLDAWMQMLKGEARIAVGARSAIFAPLKNLRLIIVDEEHDQAYKQDESPRYQGRDVAVYRAKLLNATCILGSATPSLETWHNTQRHKYQISHLKNRIDERCLPIMHIVDMRREATVSHTGGLFSRFLLEKLGERLEKKEQSILFINRRGFAPRVFCVDCGHTLQCKHCSVTLSFHQQTQHIRCHWCHFEAPAPQTCPACKKKSLQHRGMGTQRVETMLKHLFPHLRIARVDADLMNKKEAFRQIFQDFRKGQLDVLVGTQMIAKGLHFPNVTLVGLLEADLSLHLPDFRASEKTFQLLVQVAGRAGRGDRAGEVVVQTFEPACAPIQFARRSDFDGFYAAELQEREALNYPPFRHVIRHIFRSHHSAKVAFVIEKWVECLRSYGFETFDIRGPAVAPREKIQDYYRHHVWYFTHHIRRALQDIQKVRSTFKMEPDIIDVLDIDPWDMG